MPIKTPRLRVVAKEFNQKVKRLEQKRQLDPVVQAVERYVQFRHYDPLAAAAITMVASYCLTNDPQRLVDAAVLIRERYQLAEEEVDALEQKMPWVRVWSAGRAWMRCQGVKPQKPEIAEIVDQHMQLKPMYRFWLMMENWVDQRIGAEWWRADMSQHPGTIMRNLEEMYQAHDTAERWKKEQAKGGSGDD